MATTSNGNCVACTLERQDPNVKVTYADSHHTCEKGTEASGSAGTNQTGASAYTFDNYQEDAGTTAIYPDAGKESTLGVNYTILGLIGEAGEIANKWKKFFRDYPALAENDDYPSTIRDAILSELGDVLWYTSQLATELGVTLGDVAAENIRKLSSRQQRGTLNGSGDNR